MIAITGKIRKNRTSAPSKNAIWETISRSTIMLIIDCGMFHQTTDVLLFTTKLLQKSQRQAFRIYSSPISPLRRKAEIERRIKNVHSENTTRATCLSMNWKNKWENFRRRVLSIRTFSPDGQYERIVSLCGWTPLRPLINGNQSDSQKL